MHPECTHDIDDIAANSANRNARLKLVASSLGHQVASIHPLTRYPEPIVSMIRSPVLLSALCVPWGECFSLRSRRAFLRTSAVKAFLSRLLFTADFLRVLCGFSWRSLRLRSFFSYRELATLRSKAVRLARTTYSHSLRPSSPARYNRKILYR